MRANPCSPGQRNIAIRARQRTPWGLRRQLPNGRHRLDGPAAGMPVDAETAHGGRAAIGRCERRGDAGAEQRAEERRTARDRRAGWRAYGYDPTSPAPAGNAPPNYSGPDGRCGSNYSATRAVTRPTTRCALAVRSPVACGPRTRCATTASMRFSRTTAIGRFPKGSTAAGPTSAPWPNRIAARRPGPTGFRRGW